MIINFKPLKTVLCLSPLIILLSGCPTLSLISPSFTYNSNYNTGRNPNNISCDPGTWYSSAYCSIPIPKFVQITATYADPYPQNLLFEYALNHNSFFFSDVQLTPTLLKLNQQFLANYPSPSKLAQFAPALQKLYSDMKDSYIPESNFQKQSEAYTYIYVLSALDFATQACTPLNRPLSLTAHDQTEQQYMLYKAFSMQFANDIFHHISGSVDGKYNDEQDLYINFYEKILKLNPYQLDHLAIQLFRKTVPHTPTFESEFFTNNGVNFGELGTFSCTSQTTAWHRFGFEFFGVNVSGLKHTLNFKNKDVFAKTDDAPIPVSESEIPPVSDGS